MSSLYVFFLSYTFFAICAYFSKKAKSFKTIYLCTPDSTHYTILENGIKVFSWDIKDQNIQKDANSEIWQNFSTSNPNISETVIRSITKFHFLIERKETFQMHVYKSEKWTWIFCWQHYFQQFKDHNHNVHPPPLLLEMGLNFLPNFQKEGAWKDLIFRGDCWETGGELYQGFAAST